MESPHEQIRAERLAFAKAVGDHATYEWTALCVAFGHRCVRCGAKRRVTKDHIRPISAGGSDAIDNIQPLCRSCNCGKGLDMTDHRQTAPTIYTPERIATLRRSLGDTADSFGARFGRAGRTVEDWEQGRRRPDPMILIQFAAIETVLADERKRAEEEALKRKRSGATPAATSRSFLVRDLEGDTLERAHARAQEEGITLTTAIRRLVVAYANGVGLASSMGRKGGTNRAARMTPAERSALARKAVQARWAKAKAIP